MIAIPDQKHLSLSTMAAIAADLSRALAAGTVAEADKWDVCRSLLLAVHQCELRFGVETAMEALIVAGADPKGIFLAREWDEAEANRFGGDN
jgi:hypothetical protein